MAQIKLAKAQVFKRNRQSSRPSFRPLGHDARFLPVPELGNPNLAPGSLFESPRLWHPTTWDPNSPAVVILR